MFSTRNSLNRDATRRAGAQLALALAAGAALAGCARAPKPAPEPVSTAPVVVDEAMQRREDWPRATAYFQAGGVDAGATRFPYNPQTTGDGAGQASLGPERSNAALDTLAFVVQAVKLPFTYIWEPPFVDKNYRGVMYEPTHTAMPVMPPDEAPVEEGEEPTSPPEPAPVPTEDAVQDSVNTVTEPTVAPGEVPPGQDPPEAQPPVITPDSSLPAPAEPTGPAPEGAEPEQRATEPAPEPMPEATEPAPVEPAPVPETTDPVPEPAPESAPQPEAPAQDDLNK